MQPAVSTIPAREGLLGTPAYDVADTDASARSALAEPEITGG
jgi:hypothetical protein